MQKLDNRRAAYAMLPVGAENTFTRRLSAPVMGGLSFLQQCRNPHGFYAGSIPEYKTAHAGIGCGRSCAVFSAPGFFRIHGNGSAKSLLNLITGSEKANTREGITPMFSHPKTSVPAATAAPMGGER